jgi:DNA helicase IV
VDHHDLSFISRECEKYGLDARKVGISIARELLRMSVASLDAIDFDDQLYLTYVLKLVPPTYDFIFVDEAQDLSAIQRALLQRSLSNSETGRIVFVGDSKQSLYGFRGADSESIDKIVKEFRCTTFPLSISYRCPKSVVALAKKYVPYIESHEAAPDGIVGRLLNWNASTFNPTDYILCRYNAPLVKLVMRLISAGVPAVILGKSFGKNLISIVRKLDWRQKDMTFLRDQVAQWRKNECEKLLCRDPDADCGFIYDKEECIVNLIAMWEATTVEEFIRLIDGMFSDKSSLITLSSVHKVKGLESDRVFIIDTEPRTPKNRDLKPWMIQAERNIRYVAITRARKELYFLSPGGWGECED